MPCLRRRWLALLAAGLSVLAARAAPADDADLESDAATAALEQPRDKPRGGPEADRERPGDARPDRGGPRRGRPPEARRDGPRSEDFPWEGSRGPGRRLPPPEARDRGPGGPPGDARRPGPRGPEDRPGRGPEARRSEGRGPEGRRSPEDRGPQSFHFRGRGPIGPPAFRPDHPPFGPRREFAYAGSPPGRRGDRFAEPPRRSFDHARRQLARDRDAGRCGHEFGGRHRGGEFARHDERRDGWGPPPGPRGAWAWRAGWSHDGAHRMPPGPHGDGDRAERFRDRSEPGWRHEEGRPPFPPPPRRGGERRGYGFIDDDEQAEMELSDAEFAPAVESDPGVVPDEADVADEYEPVTFGSRKVVRLVSYINKEENADDDKAPPTGARKEGDGGNAERKDDPPPPPPPARKRPPRTRDGGPEARDGERFPPEGGPGPRGDRPDGPPPEGRGGPRGGRGPDGQSGPPLPWMNGPPGGRGPGGYGPGYMRQQGRMYSGRERPGDEGEADPEALKLQEADFRLLRRTHELSEQFRDTPAADKEKREKLREDLTQTVKEHFEVRQKTRELELRRIEAQLDRLRKSVKMHSDNQAEIVKKRISTLLAEDDLDF